MLARGVEFPYVHDIGLLLTLLEDAGETVPEEIRQAEILNLYATATRYPSTAQPVLEHEYAEALRIAESVVQWTEIRL